MDYKKILFLSNGHGEDVCNAQIIEALLSLDPTVCLAAVPIVGEGNAYRRLGVGILTPTRNLPSGGFLYMNPLVFLKDLVSGLIALTVKQLQVIFQEAKNYDLLMVTGDIVVVAIAFFTRRPFVVFLSAYSSYYEGQLNLGLILPYLLNSRRCLAVYTRDAFTAQDLTQQGIKKAEFVGTPMMDNLMPSGVHLHLKSGIPMIALLPGSRLPEAQRNFVLLLQLIEQLTNLSSQPLQFRAALVPSLMAELDSVAATLGWQHDQGKLIGNSKTEVICYSNAFADILQGSNLVLGMAGTANEQAVGLGKPVITIPGEGPAFTYRFAEAQSRLLGGSIQLVGRKSADMSILQDAAKCAIQTLENWDYLQQCLNNGEERMGKPGGSLKIAEMLCQSSQARK